MCSVLQSYHCYKWVNISYLIHFTHLKLLSIPAYRGPIRMYILRIALQIAIADIYEMFILKFRIVEEETSVSKTCGVAFVWWLLSCTLTMRALLHTLACSPSFPSEGKSDRKESPVERLLDCYTGNLVYGSCMQNARRILLKTRLTRELQVRIQSVCNNARASCLHEYLFSARSEFGLNKLTELLNQGIHLTGAYGCLLVLYITLLWICCVSFLGLSKKGLSCLSLI